MKTAAKIDRKIRRIPEGQPFRYQQLGLERSEYLAGAKALERLIAKGDIQRISKGVFYKPKISVFGELPPQEADLLKPYLFTKGKRIAYITGHALYNRLGLTTQVPNTIKVASRQKRITTRVGNTLVTGVKSYVEVSHDNFRLLELLDVLKDFKNIPDLDDRVGVAIMQTQLNGLTDAERSKLLRNALQYPPRAIALLGALLENAGMMEGLDTLRNALNPLSSYNQGIRPEVLPTVANWNIY